MWRLPRNNQASKTRGRLAARPFHRLKSCYHATMARDEVIRRLKEREPDLRARGVVHAALFGSVARGEERPDSDIDIMVKIAPDSHMDLFGYMGIVHLIEDMFPIRVDVANHARLKAYVRTGIERDAIYAF